MAFAWQKLGMAVCMWYLAKGNFCVICAFLWKEDILLACGILFFVAQKAQKAQKWAFGGQKLGDGGCHFGI